MGHLQEILDGGFVFVTHLTSPEVAELNGKLAKREYLESEARSTVGIWSHYGIQDARDLFWNSYERGKQTAKRYTMFDALFSMGSRDESFVAFVLRIAFSFILNTIIAMIMAVISFLWNLWTLLVTYQTSLVFHSRSLCSRQVERPFLLCFIRARSRCLFLIVASTHIAVSLMFTYVFLM